ncbi:DUF3800 domain-containing protein [Bacillus sp. ISL-40]|uniref:DUF3800 domain-containing protein n=1 Tax=unclassified Bacillus (in: firmicutes) TaxID=185979 RepID=UPI001BEA1D47|nr:MULTISPECIES: DUF3800 domain-containing protein [unclassified Bacillus (in: firmicutes)]MBT2700344.1 DUF3800 domain-containing protein [Bacillus sp. ISL-40]MBT2740878.1 DUF3800 domain-containing protein [Bacillus sp. ISL-77]
MNDIQFAFIDESGDYSFDFENKDVSTHFIIVSILAKESNKELLEQEVEKVRQKYFQTDEMHTDKINNPHLRIQLLNELKDLPFNIYAYVVDKRKIREDSGITFEKTFIKFMNRLIYDDLNRTFDQLDLVLVEQGTKEFMTEFKTYIAEKSVPDLFNYSIFGFNHSKSELLLQLANFIAGTIAKGYDQTQYSEHYPLFHKIIKKKIIAINLWPQSYKNYLHDYISRNQDSQFDEVIFKQSVNLTLQYLENKKSEDADEKIRIDLLKFLLFNLRENPNEYVYTQEILDNLNAIRVNKINHHYFRSNIVSKLRDSGLLIASSNKGYKLPVCLTDLYDFVNLSSLTIHPMIQRISKCRNQVLLATNNEIDILENNEYEYLKKIIELEKLAVTE